MARSFVFWVVLAHRLIDHGLSLFNAHLVFLATDLASLNPGAPLRKMVYFSFHDGIHGAHLALI